MEKNLSCRPVVPCIRLVRCRCSLACGVGTVGQGIAWAIAAHGVAVFRGFPQLQCVERQIAGRELEGVDDRIVVATQERRACVRGRKDATA